MESSPRDSRAVSVLAVGDIHLGRRPSRVPSAYDTAKLGPARALELVVTEALTRRVDAVLLAGDVVDSDKAWYEAYGALHKAVKKLTESGIACLGVAGNHDVQVLPRLAKELPAFRLIGEGGHWTTALIEREGCPVLRVLGWSFPRREVRESPLASMPVGYRAGNYADGAPDELPTIGLLHGDLGVPSSPHAPLVRHELEAVRGLRAWMLGHIHAPSLDPAASFPLGYLGSLAALDPGEPGRHGPWLTHIHGASLALEQLPLSPVRYEKLSIDITDLSSSEELQAALPEALRQRAEELEAELGAAEVICARVTLIGRTTLSRAERNQALAGVQDLDCEHGGRNFIVVEPVEDRSAPNLDIAALARDGTPAGLLARRVLDLTADSPETRALIATARQRLHAAARHPNFQDLDPLPIDDATVKERLLLMSRRALEDLVSQRLPFGREKDA